MSETVFGIALAWAAGTFVFMALLTSPSIYGRFSWAIATTLSFLLWNLTEIEWIGTASWVLFGVTLYATLIDKEDRFERDIRRLNRGGFRR